MVRIHETHVLGTCPLPLVHIISFSFPIFYCWVLFSFVFWICFFLFPLHPLDFFSENFTMIHLVLVLLSAFGFMIFGFTAASSLDIHLIQDWQVYHWWAMVGNGSWMFMMVRDICTHARLATSPGSPRSIRQSCPTLWTSSQTSRGNLERTHSCSEWGLPIESNWRSCLRPFGAYSYSQIELFSRETCAFVQESFHTEMWSQWWHTWVVPSTDETPIPGNGKWWSFH